MRALGMHSTSDLKVDGVQQQMTTIFSTYVRQKQEAEAEVVTGLSEAS